MKTFFLEGYGCSLNISETEQIDGFLRRNNFARVNDFSSAGFLIINTCSVKQNTEQRMLSRIRFLLSKKEPQAKLIVTGCLASAQHNSVEEIDKKIIVLDNSLSSLCIALGIKEKEFSPSIVPTKSRERISIIPVSTGCLGECSYCSARLARKELHSYSVDSITDAFVRALYGETGQMSSVEFWLTSQDLGCYGFDIKGSSKSASSLSLLLKKILLIGGNYRLRLGMMNPNHFNKIKEELMPLFLDARLYKFLHIPIQSGSDKILKLMKRKYSVREFIECVNFARKAQPKITIATDIIVGFPGESKKDFDDTLKILKKVRPDVVNISRFGKRKGTLAEKFPLQLSETEKKGRSRFLAKFCDELFKEKNSSRTGEVVDCLVSERTHNGFNARTNSYETVFLKSGFGEFVRAKITKVKKHYFEGEVLK